MTAPHFLRSLAIVMIGVVSMTSAALAQEEGDSEGPGLDALDEFRNKRGHANAIENRFFLKQRRWEIAPVIGYVPNNSFARRYVGGITFGYHFTEEVAAEMQLTYSPDLGEDDLKGLTTVLIDRAHNAASQSSGSGFQQPLDKVTLSTVFGLAWAPFYGKINLVGETVLSFDFYGFGGLGMLAKSNYNAKYDEVGANPDTGDIVILEPAGNEFKVGPVFGTGTNIFITSSIALKLDVRMALFLDEKPQYDPDVAVSQMQIYQNLITSVGVSFFFPKPPPRIYNF
jgi:outer membrane beta-barrel protein